MTWFQVLEAARRISEVSPTGEFTASELALEAGLQESKKSTADQLASAWLGKFCRWGYALRTGSSPGQKKWIRVYTLTKFGKEMKPNDPEEA